MKLKPGDIVKTSEGKTYRVCLAVEIRLRFGALPAAASPSTIFGISQDKRQYAYWSAGSTPIRNRIVEVISETPNHLKGNHMATRCNIIAHLSDGTFRSIYVHFDGYPEGVGKNLLEHYNTQELAEKVTSLGALSILGQSCECPPGHTFKTPVGGFSVAYHRDRQEPFEDTRAGLGATPVQALDDNPVQGAEYNYLWVDGAWYLLYPDYSCTPLTYLLNKT